MSEPWAFDEMAGFYRRGDMNGDGLVNNNDINPFVMALVDRRGYIEAYGLDPDWVGDITGSGRISNNDIGAFVSLLTAGQAASIPEPASALMLVVGLAGVVLRRRRS